MEDDYFEWDDAKAEGNLRKHRIDFWDARLVFDDPGLVDDVDVSADYGEERFRTVGIANGRLIAVFYTMRGNRIRIISARKPTRSEQDEYARQNPT